MELAIKIAENDPVRKLVEICEELDYTELYKRYVRRWRKVSPETLFELVYQGEINIPDGARYEQTLHSDYWVLKDLMTWDEIVIYQ